MNYDDVTTNPIWRTAAILKIVFGYISTSARLTRNSVRRNTIMFRHKSRDQNTNYRKFKMAEGRHFKNVFSLYLRRESFDFNEIWYADANFGSNNSHVANIKILQIQYGGRPPCWKSFFGYISTIYCPINEKFGTKKQDHVRPRSRDTNCARGRHNMPHPMQVDF